MTTEQNNGGPSDDEIRRLVNLPFNQDENGTEWVSLTPQMLARAVRRALATTEPTSKQSLQVGPAVNQQLTTEPVDELPEPHAVITGKLGAHCSFNSNELRKGDPIYTADQMRAAMAQVGDINVVESFTNDTKDAERYRWLRDDTDSDWAICEWSHAPGDEGYYRDARAPHIVDAAIDAAMAKGVKG